MNDILSYLNEHHIPYERNVDLKKRTWIHCGGVAGVWITPDSCAQLVGLCEYLYSIKADFKLVGHTSNIYFKNTYNPSIIISTAKLTHFDIESNYIRCECGVSVKTLAAYAIENGYKGFEGLVDLPGTIAAAIYNNSGCYQCSVAQMLHHIDFLTTEGKMVELTKDDLLYSERSSVLKRGELHGVMINIYLTLQKTDDPEELTRQAKRNHTHRQTYQEKPANTLGSIFPMYVYNAFEANLSFGTKALVRALSILRRLHCLSYHQFTKRKRDCILLCNGLWSIRNYVSEYTFNTFIWKDAGAEHAFEQYRAFVQKTALSDQIEIEIIQ